MIRFEYQYEDHAPKVVIELHSDSSLSEVVEHFERFLLASGYSFDGKLDFVEDEPADAISN